MKRLFLSALILLSGASFAQADVSPLEAKARKQSTVPTVSLGRSETIFLNPASECAVNGTCDLKQVIFRKVDYISPHDPSDPDDVLILGSKIFLGFQTESLDTLTNYLPVQVERGCMWYSHPGPDGKLVTEFGIVKSYMGKWQVPHVYRDWTVDSTDTDPAYGSRGDDRSYSLEWSPKIPTWIPDGQGNLFGEEKPTVPFLYTKDEPGPAVYAFGLKQARNMSLEFKTCLFRREDVPLISNGYDIALEKAVVCFSWDSKFVFDHAKLRFVRQQEIHPECQRPLSEHEERVRMRLRPVDGEDSRIDVPLPLKADPEAKTDGETKK